MEAHSRTTGIPYYSKAGFLYTLLPYLGRYNGWARILVLTCKQSKQIWDKNQVVFKNLDTKIQHIQCTKLKALYEDLFDEEIEFNEDLNLYLDMSCNKSLEFMIKSSKYGFPSYNQLRIDCIPGKCNSDMIEIINKFLESGVPGSIQNFIFRGIRLERLSIDHFKAGILRIVPSVAKAISIESCCIPKDVLTYIFQNANGETLHLIRGCSCGNKGHKEGGFRLDPLLHYNIKNVWFHGTRNGYNREFFQDTQFSYMLAAVFGETNMKTDLREFIYETGDSDQEQIQKDIRRMFWRYGTKTQAKPKYSIGEHSLYYKGSNKPYFSI